MNQEITTPELEELQELYDLQMEANSSLHAIEGHLKSIRSMLTFFTVLAILAIVVQACNVLTAY